MFRGDVKGGHTCLLLPGGAFSIAAGQDGFPVASGKLAFCPEEARHEEVKQRPQLQDVVLRRDDTSDKRTRESEVHHAEENAAHLDGRSRQDDAEICGQLLDGFRKFGFAIFDHVTLVEDAVIKLDVSAKSATAGQALKPRPPTQR